MTMRHAEHVMGTVFSFDLPDPALADGALHDAIEWLHWVDATFSTYRDDSDISRLGRGELRVEDCPREVADVLDLCVEAAQRTDGYFTATPGGHLDPSGLVKGWAVEDVSRRLTAAGSRWHSVGGGGDIQMAGGHTEPWRVGIAHPHHPGQLAAVVEVGDGAVATSGTAERGSHVVNPRTGAPATELAAVTVVGPELTWADVYATAALARGADARGWLANLCGYDALVIGADGSTWCTPGFPAYLADSHSQHTEKPQQAVSNLIEG
jgi:thiamine biosynthesis lipoprotein